MITAKLKKKIINSEMIKLILYTSLVQLLFYFSYNSSEFFSYIGVVVIMFLCLTLNLEQLSMLFFALIPNQRLLVINVSDISMINIVIFSMLFKLIIVNKVILNKKNTIFILLFIITSIPATYYGGLSNFILFFRVSILFIVLSNIKRTSNNEICFYTKIILIFAIGTFIMGIMGIIFDPNFIIGSNNYRLAGSLTNNPNDFAMIIIVALSVLLNNFTFFNKKSSISVFLIFSLTLLGILTQSRTFLLGFAIFLPIIMVKIKFKKIYKVKIKAFLTVFIILFTLYIITITDSFETVISPALERVENPRGGDISAGRFDIWRDYIIFFKNNPKYFLFGIGGNFKLLSSYGINYMAHNFIIEQIANWGIINFFVTLGIFQQFFIKIRTTKRKFNIIHYYPLIILIILSLTRHAAINISFITSFYICVISADLFIYSEKII